jgi:hypothetical protein
MAKAKELGVSMSKEQTGPRKHHCLDLSVLNKVLTMDLLKVCDNKQEHSVQMMLRVATTGSCIG